MKVSKINVLALTVPKIYRNLNLFLGINIPNIAATPITAPDAPSEGIFPKSITTAKTACVNEPTRPENKLILFYFLFLLSNLHSIICNEAFKKVFVPLASDFLYFFLELKVIF